MDDPQGIKAASTKAVRSAGPRLGEHNQEVYGRRLGLSSGQGRPPGGRVE